MTQEQKTKISEHFDWLHTTATASNVPDDLKDVLKAAYLAGAAYALDTYCPHWISVDEESESPKEHEWIIGFSLKRSYVDIYNYDSNGLFEAHGITHWMHLSPPPIITSSKEGGKE